MDLLPCCQQHCNTSEDPLTCSWAVGRTDALSWEHQPSIYALSNHGYVDILGNPATSNKFGFVLWRKFVVFPSHVYENCIHRSEISWNCVWILFICLQILIHIDVYTCTWSQTHTLAHTHTRRHMHIYHFRGWYFWSSLTPSFCAHQRNSEQCRAGDLRSSKQFCEQFKDGGPRSNGW